MGGRGGASHRAAASGGFHQAERLARQLQVRLDTASLIRARILPQYVMETLKGVKAIVDAFPVMKGKVSYLDANETRSSAYASAGGDGGLHMGLYGRMTPERLKETWEMCLRTGFHPEGTTSASIFVHEMGHQIEAYLNKRDYGNPWVWGKTADKVVWEGIQRVDPTVSGLHTKEAYQIAKSISGYAVDGYRASTKSWSTWETLAEAVSDYYENEERAKPLSREIWSILRRELNR